MKHYLLFFLFAYSFGANAQTMPSQPFERLLYRLNHAPVNLRAASQSAGRGNKMQQSAAALSQSSAKATPLLKSIAANRALAVLSHVPLVGRPARWAQETCTSLANLNRDFTRLVDVDRRHLQPLRAAALSGERLRHSRRRADLPEAVKSFQNAAQILQDDENRARQQREKLAKTASALKQLAPHVEKRVAGSPTKAAEWRRLKSSVQGAQQALDARLTQLSTLRRFAIDCARDGKEAMKP